MSIIKIQRLSLENFKGHKLLHLVFDGGNASIYGCNGAGKTSVYDALTWLLFGKDSAGKGEKNMGIKPVDITGDVADHQAITSVEAELTVDGGVLTLKREYREVWGTRRGSSVEVFEGNTSDYYVNGVPSKKGAYDEKVAALVPEDLFRMLTSVSYFAEKMSWQKRREVLFDMAGTLTDSVIMAREERFLPLLEDMGKLDLEDYKKVLTSQRKGFASTKTEIPARISECQKTIEDLETLDFAAAKAEVEALVARKDSLTEQLIAIENDAAMSNKRLEIREVQLEFRTLENENQNYRRSQQTSSAGISALKSDLQALQVRLAGRRKLVQSEEQFISSFEEKIQNSREEWSRVNDEVFAGGTCVACGQPLPADKLQSAQDAFESRKRNRLREVESAAASLKDAKAQAEYRLVSYQEEIGQLEVQIQGREQQIAQMEANIVVVVDMEDYAQRKSAIQSRMDALNAELAAMAEDSATVKSGIQEQIRQVGADLSKQMEIIVKESVLTYSKGRIEQLRQDAKNAAEALEAIDKMLFTIEEYTRYKTRFVEDSINGMFRLTQWRLYREQANGGLEDRCDAVYNGVPYEESLNNGMRVNVGIDIINALSRHYGVSVPLFVDNAESVTDLEQTDAQRIRLVVSAEDKKLRCVNEDP